MRMNRIFAARIWPLLLFTFGTLGILACKTAQDSLEMGLSAARPLSESQIAKIVGDLNFLIGIDRAEYFKREVTEFAADQIHAGEREELEKLTPYSLISDTSPSTFFEICKSTDPQKVFDLYSKITNLTRIDFAKIDSTKLRNLGDELVGKFRFRFDPSSAAEAARQPWAISTCSTQGPRNPVPEPGVNPRANFDAVPYWEFPVPPGNKHDMTLDTEAYMATRSTRALFWHVILHPEDVDIEFHMGTQVDFDERVFLRGGRILGEIKPIDSNYNKMFLVQYPGHKQLTYAINKISGSDRLGHLVHQLSMTSLDGSAMQPPKSVRVYGNPEHAKDLFQEEISLWMSSLPDPDRIIIGQKQGLENFVTTSLNNIDPVFVDLLNPMIGMSDIVFSGRGGKVTRWRIFSNMNGDEMQPLARALDNFYRTSKSLPPVVYVGTAGMFPSVRNRAVGLVVSPNSLIDKSFGDEIDFRKSPTTLFRGGDPALFRKDYRLVQVTSLYDESMSWFREAVRHGAEMVELETHHLAKYLKIPTLEIYLMVSDIITTEESLDKADPSKRQAGKMHLFNTMFNLDGARAGIKGPELFFAEGSAKIPGANYLYRSFRGGKFADPALHYWLRQSSQNNLTDASAKQLLDSTTPFTTKDIERELLGLGSRLVDELFDFGFVATGPNSGDPDKVFEKGDMEIWVSENLVKGTWNPADTKTPTNSLVVAISPNQYLSQSAVQDLGNSLNSGPIRVEAAASGDHSAMVKLPVERCEYLRRCFLDLYNWSAYENGRLLASYGKDGILKYYQMPL